MNAEAGFYSGEGLLGNEGVTPVFTGRSSSIAPNRLSNLLYGLAKGFPSFDIYFDVHSSPSNPGLSGYSGDIGTANSIGIAVVAIDPDGATYSYNPRG